MTARRSASRWIALGGLAVLVAVILFPAPRLLNLIVAAPLIVLFFTGLKPPPRWGGWAAVAMVPYLCVSLGEAIVDPANRATYGFVVGCTLLVFFASMDFVRQTGASLRR
jgi:uncharacterized membrane protein